MPQKQPNPKLNNSSQTQSPSLQESISFLTEKSKDLIGIITGFASLAYVTGFIINNTYLGSFGIYDFSLINSRYIYIGTVFLLFFFINIYYAFGLSSNLRKYKKFKIQAFNIIMNLLYLYVSARLTTVLFLYLAYWGSPNVHPLSMFQLNTSILWWNIFATVISLVMIRIIQDNIWEKIKSPLPFTSSPFVAFLLVSVLYSVQCYRFMPITLGGGSPIEMQLIIDKEQMPNFSEILDFQRENITEPIYLLEKGSATYYFLKNKDDEQALQIHQDIVVGVINHSRIKTPLSEFTNSTATKTAIPLPTVFESPTP